MQRTFSPAPSAQTNVYQLGFWARAAIVTSGPNYVSLPAAGMLIPPLSVGVVVPIDPAQQTAEIVVVAPPSAVALGGSTQPTTITYTSQALPAQTGAVLGSLAAEATGFIYGSAGFSQGPGGIQTRSLTFPARSALVDTGANYVSFPDLPRLLPPWTYHAIVHLPTPTSAPRDQTVASYPSGSTQNPNVGPAAAQLTNLQYLEQAFAPSPGIPAPFPQQLAFDYHFPSGDGSVTTFFARGLARWLSLAIFNTSGAGSGWDIYGTVNGTLQILVSNAAIAAGATGVFTFGQGGTYPLADQIGFKNHVAGGVAYDASARGTF